MSYIVSVFIMSLISRKSLWGPPDTFYPHLHIFFSFYSVCQAYVTICFEKQFTHVPQKIKRADPHLSLCSVGLQRKDPTSFKYSQHLPQYQNMNMTFPPKHHHQDEHGSIDKSMLFDPFKLVLLSICSKNNQENEWPDFHEISCGYSWSTGHLDVSFTHTIRNKHSICSQIEKY